MEYHKDRYNDCSMVVFKNNKIVALVPANQQGDTVFSHSGLTYGGIVLNKEIKLNEVWSIYQEILEYLHKLGFNKFVIKEIPSTYCTYPSDEFSYLTQILNAQRIRLDLSSTIYLSEPLKIQSNRMEGVKKGLKQGLEIKEEPVFSNFWNHILIPNLERQHETKPTHSLSEIEGLAAIFPNKIIQFNVYLKDKIVGGATIFDHGNLVHVQYISADIDKQELGTLDYLFHYLITERYKGRKYFDFGISNEDQGKKVNKGLLFWKECFGARSVSHSFYALDTSKYKNLDTVFI